MYLYFKQIVVLSVSFVLMLSVGGQMTTLKGEDIDYSGSPLNKGGLVASVGLDHMAVVKKLPEFDPENH